MNIAIIGAGFTGLSAAYKLLEKGHKITLFEKDSFPGGLAVGFKDKNWEWPLEKHYHHWFTNDDSVLNLAKQIDYEYWYYISNDIGERIFRICIINRISSFPARKQKTIALQLRINDLPVILGR